MAINALDLIDEQLTRAAEAPKSKGKPIFLFLKEGHKAVVRPLYDLKDALVLKKHSKYAEDPSQRVNAICASEIGKSCVYCHRAENDRKLSAQLHFYVLSHVHSVLDSKGEKVTFKSKNEDGDEVVKEVQGPRLLELAAFGTAGKILKTFREYVRDEEISLSALDWTITQVGKGQQKDFVTLPKAPKAMPEQLRKMLQQDAFTPENIRLKILDALPPVSSEDKDDPFKDTPRKEETAGMQAASEDLDDTITDF